MNQQQDEAVVIVQSEPSAPASPAKPRGGWRRRLQSQGLTVMLLALIVYFTVQSPYFLTWSNLLTIVTGAFALGVMAAAQTPLMVSGGFDVSVGSVVALTTVVFGMLTAGGMQSVLAMVVVLVVAGAVGALNAALVVALKVNPLIATLGTMSVFAGLAFLLSSGQTQVVLDPVLDWFTSTRIAGIPVLVIILVLVYAIALLVERRTVTGRYVYAIGDSRDAARLAGLPVNRLPFVLYILSAVSAGVAGLIVTGQLGSASPQVGSTYMLAVVTAVILGGTSLSGGRGSVIGTLLAVLILGVLQNGFALLQLSSYVQTVALGVALIVAVLIDHATRRLET